MPNARGFLETSCGRDASPSSPLAGGGSRTNHIKSQRKFWKTKRIWHNGPQRLDCILFPPTYNGTGLVWLLLGANLRPRHCRHALPSNWPRSLSSSASASIAFPAFSEPPHLHIFLVLQPSLIRAANRPCVCSACRAWMSSRFPSTLLWMGHRLRTPQLHDEQHSVCLSVLSPVGLARVLSHAIRGGSAVATPQR